MLPEIAKAVAKVKNTLSGIVSHNPDETNTKNSLINPILRSLGWDESDWKRVKAEFQLSDHIKHKVDYALMDRSGGTPRAFVEAKRLNDRLSGEAQLLDYAGAYLGNKGFEATGEFACIVFTNGREWRFYPVNAQKGSQYYDGWCRKIDLENEDAERCAERLSLLLSESSICEGSAKQRLTAEFKEQRIEQEWRRMITQPDEALVKLLRRQLKDYGISKEEAARAIRRPMPKLPDENLAAPPADKADGILSAQVAPVIVTPKPTPAAKPAQPDEKLSGLSAERDGTVPSSEDQGHQKKKPKPRLRVTVGSKEFDSAQFSYLNRMLPKVLKAIMELKAISGHRLVQACIEAKITGSNSRAWVVSADMLAELRNSPNRRARVSARASKAIDAREDYFVLTNHGTELHASKLERLGRALGLGADLKVDCTPSSLSPDQTD